MLLLAVLVLARRGEAVDEITAGGSWTRAYGKVPADSTGTNNGDLVNCDPELWNATGGHDGGCVLGFDGGDDYVDCGSDAALMPAQFTIASWMEAAEMRHQVAVDKYPSGTGYGWTVKFRDDGAS